MSANGLTGLANLGNTCVINSCMQVLSHTRELKKFLDKGNGSYKDNVSAYHNKAENKSVEDDDKSLAEILDIEYASEEESKSLSISLSAMEPSGAMNQNSEEQKIVVDPEDISLKIARYVQNLDALSSEGKAE